MNAKLMYNSSGFDECFAELDTNDMLTDQQAVEHLCAQVSFCWNIPFDAFECEHVDAPGRVYGFDGIGIFIANDEADWERLYACWHQHVHGDMINQPVLITGN